MHKSTIAFRLLKQMTIVVQKMRLTSSAQIAAILMLAAVR
jgi:transposase